VLNIAPTAPLLVTLVEQVQDFTLDPLSSAGQPLGSGMIGVQLTEKPSKIDPEFGVAVRVTGAFNEKFPVQPSSPPQMIPAGLLITLPDPSPASWTVKEGALLGPHDPTANFAVSVSELPLAPGAAAVMVVPGPDPMLLQKADSVTSPVELTVATRLSLVDHFTWSVKSLVAVEPA
jgi:hypothetical protein